MFTKTVETIFTLWNINFVSGQLNNLKIFVITIFIRYLLDHHI